jgi:hypothetical protein
MMSSAVEAWLRRKTVFTLMQALPPPMKIAPP